MKTELKWWIPLSILAFSLYAYTNTTPTATSTPQPTEIPTPNPVILGSEVLPSFGF